MKLSALNDAVEQTAPRTSGISSLMELELSQIYANPDQPRKHFDPVSLAELAESIKTKGLLQPISVVRRPDGYMIIAGERRYRAHQINGSITIKTNVFDRGDHTVEELALIENIQREDLSDYEIAMAIVRLWESGKYKQKQDLAGAIQKPLSYVSKALGLLKLDPTIKADIEENKRDIGLSVLEELSRVKEPEKQREIYQRYNAGEIKRDEFKTAAEPKAKKISRGKMKHVSTIFAKGGDSVESINFDKIISTLDPEKQYRITIEEIV